MDNSTQSSKAVTRHIAIADPDVENLKAQLEGRSLSPELFEFLTKMVKNHKWTQNITIPSTHDDVAVVLLFTSALKEAGLEILIEIHVFYKGQTVTEAWEMLPETEPPSSLPPKIFSSLDIEKVRVEGDLVRVELKLVIPSGEKKIVLKTYDFSSEKPAICTEALPKNSSV